MLETGSKRQGCCLAIPGQNLCVHLLPLRTKVLARGGPAPPFAFLGRGYCWGYSNKYLGYWNCTTASGKDHGVPRTVRHLAEVQHRQGERHSGQCGHERVLHGLPGSHPQESGLNGVLGCPDRSNSEAGAGEVLEERPGGCTLAAMYRCSPTKLLPRLLHGRPPERTTSTTACRASLGAIASPLRRRIAAGHQSGSMLRGMCRGIISK